MRTIRGAEIAMIFQEPMTSLNPVYTIGSQLGAKVRSKLFDDWLILAGDVGAHEQLVGTDGQLLELGDAGDRQSHAGASCRELHHDGAGCRSA